MLHQTFSTVIRFCVRVPVLSLAMMVATPRFSMMSVRLINTRRSRRRNAVSASREVTVAGKPCRCQAHNKFQVAIHMAQTPPRASFVLCPQCAQTSIPLFGPTNRAGLDTLCRQAVTRCPHKVGAAPQAHWPPPPG